MKIESFGVSNVGMKRGQNEDNYLINDDLHLYVVADGMGGHLGGEFASKMAVSTVEEVVERLSNPEATQIHGVNGEETEYGERLRFAIREAGRRIYDQALYDETLKGMGTTAVAILVNETKAYVANVGDSRGYLVRNGTIEQITEDHSLVSEQIKAGILNAQDAKTHRLKNIITRSVGYQEDVDSDIVVIDLKQGDRFLLCSDGLSNLVDDQEICKALSSPGVSLESACHS
ncbi:MAG: serine/threonine-protein phosphatase, partial [Deltaproteobacteria bacterium]|nr:serine/threonine-protein phosphatase [Deltaproteobacteria bacterium]